MDGKQSLLFPAASGTEQSLLEEGYSYTYWVSLAEFNPLQGVLSHQVN